MSSAAATSTAGTGASSTGGTALAAKSGTATSYTLGGLPNCSYPSVPAAGRYVALSPGEYASGAACGELLTVTGPKGTVQVTVVDQCPECATGHIDLGTGAFAAIADPVAGIVPVSYARVVNPALTGPLTIRVKEGSSQYWLAVLVLNTGNPLTSVEVGTSAGGWLRLQRQSYNYWQAASGAGAGPLTLRITDDQGHQRTVTGIAVTAGSTQTTSVRMY